MSCMHRRKPGSEFRCNTSHLAGIVAGESFHCSLEIRILQQFQEGLEFLSAIMRRRDYKIVTFMIEGDEIELQGACSGMDPQAAIRAAGGNCSRDRQMGIFLLLVALYGRAVEPLQAEMVVEQHPRSRAALERG